MLDAKQQTGRNSYPYLANFNVQWFRFNLENLNKMDFDEKDRAEFELREGDLLVCEGGEIGRCAVWHNELQPCFFQKALHRVRCNHQIILPDYLAWWFRYNCDYGGFSALAGAKATIAHLPGAKLKQFPDSVVGFIANERTNNIFVHYWFSFFQAILESQAPESAQKNINLKILSELKVIVPEKRKQDQFASFVKLTDKSKVAVRKY